MTLFTATKYFPVLEWGRTYNRQALFSDVVAALIVTIMLVPQSLAYALLAGLPPEMGLYASIVPILLYTIFGTSRTLAVGPVAVISLMTAAAIGKVIEPGSILYVEAAMTLALLSGGILLLFGFLKLGFLADFLSHPVIAGFITASGIIIAASQLKHLLGIEASGHDLVTITASLLKNLNQVHWLTLWLGVPTTLFLFWLRKGLKPVLLSVGLSDNLATIFTRAGPVIAVVSTTLIVWIFDLESSGVSVVGSVPQTLPPFKIPSFSTDLIKVLLIPALLLSVIGFVESISVAQTLAAKKRQRIKPDQELIGLGAANIGAAFSGGFPVTGGFSRSVVNYDAGAETPAAGAYTAIGLAIVAVALTPLIYYLPKATLAATIIVAVLSLVDFSILKRTWKYSKADFLAVLVTIALTLTLGVEIGVSAGIIVSIVMFLRKTAKPHIAEVGLLPDTQHFRNIHRHQVISDPAVLTIRIDESLYFANARYLESYLGNRVVDSSSIRHVILMCSAVNDIDISALETLESIKHRLDSMDINLHLSEVKGPVMDKLKRSHFLDDLNGKVFLSQYDAFSALVKINRGNDI